MKKGMKTMVKMTTNGLSIEKEHLGEIVGENIVKQIKLNTVETFSVSFKALHLMEISG